MTVRITYGHAYLVDCDTVTGWTEDAVLGANGAFSVVNKDWFDVENTGGAVDYFLDNDTDIDKSTTTWPLFLYRYKTDSTGVKAQIIVEFDDATIQTVLAETANQTTFAVGGVTLTSGKVLDHIRFYANDVAGHVYYDFALAYKWYIDLPNYAYGLDWTPNVADVYMHPPGRSTSITQHMGDAGATCHVGCDLTQGAWTITGHGEYDAYAGVVFDAIAHEATSNKEPWQWVSGLEGRSMKATIHPHFFYDEHNTRRRLELELHECSLGDKANETFEERWTIT